MGTIRLGTFCVSGNRIDYEDAISPVRPITLPKFVERLRLRNMHDANGNNKKLLSTEDEYRILNGEWYRAGGTKVCETCGKLYSQHTEVTGALWLNRLCNGDLVKL